jgi:hypothetical protein
MGRILFPCIHTLSNRILLCPTKLAAIALILLFQKYILIVIGQFLEAKTVLTVIAY